MKKITILFIIGLIALTTRVTQAQVPNLITNGQTFVQSAQQYFTSINTNYTFSGVKIELSSGYAQVAGVNAASKVDGQYDFGNIAIEGTVQFSGIGSAINGGEAGAEYALINHYDTKVELGLLAGYDDTKQDSRGIRVGSPVIEPEVSLKKKMTPNTFSEVKLSLPVYFVGKFNSSPTIYIGVGFTY